MPKKSLRALSILVLATLFLSVPCAAAYDWLISPDWIINNPHWSGDSDAPTYTTVGHNTTYWYQPCMFGCYSNDNTALGTYIFSTNNTGVWTNSSAQKFVSTPSWANYTAALNDTLGNVVSYRFFLTDLFGNQNVTVIYNFTVTELPVALTATYPSNTTYNSAVVPVDLAATGGTIDHIWFNVWDGSAWLYASNQTYTTATTISIGASGSYTFFGYMNNTYGSANSTNVNFTVSLPLVPISLSVAHPKVLSYPTSSVPIELSASGGTLDTIWFNVKEGSTWVYTGDIVYTGLTSLTLPNGVYTFWGYCNNTSGASDTKAVTFTVVAPVVPIGGGPSGATATPTPEPTVNIDPADLPINSGTAQFGILVILGVLASSFLLYAVDHQKKTNKWKPKDPLKSIPWKAKPKDVKRGEKWSKDKKR